MKKIHIIGLLTLVLLTSACSITNTYMSGKLLMSVQQGMTPNEVHAIFGSEPDYRRFDGAMEEWEYCRYSSSAGGWTIVLIQFTDGRVSGMDSFKRGVETNAAISPTAVTTIVDFPNRAPNVQNKIEVMSELEFDRFLNDMKFTMRTEDQKKKIEKALDNHDFTSGQTQKLVNLIFNPQDKVEVMKIIYPYVTDKRNFNKVVETLNFSVYKDDVRKFIDEYHKNKR